MSSSVTLLFTLSLANYQSAPYDLPVHLQYDYIPDLISILSSVLAQLTLDDFLFCTTLNDYTAATDWHTSYPN